MKTAGSSITRIAKYSFLDEVRQKSFLVMFTLCLVCVFLVRGCYHGDYTVNGQVLDSGVIAGAVSKAAFHGIALVAMLIAALFSMRLFTRDRDGGMQSAVLSKPITRRQYVIGKVLGLWVLTTFFMLLLHVVVFLVAAVTARVVMPGYLVASLLCSLNLLFVVLAVLLLSLLMPEIIAFLCVIGIAVIGAMTEGIYALGSQLTHASAGSHGASLSLGKILYYLWPKLSGMQYLASSLIDGGRNIQGFWSIYPLLNILFYCAIVSVLLLLVFNKEEIA